MKSVFIGGSRRLGRVNAELSRRLDNIVEQGLRVLVGDAGGFDRAAQAHLAERGYGAVVVYCTAGVCRNNVGAWPVHAVEYAGRDRGREFYTAKDDAMLAQADYGLFAWDGESKGTLRNIVKLAERGKPSVVYISTTKTMVTIRDPQEARRLSEGAHSTQLVLADLWGETSENGQVP